MVMKWMGVVAKSVFYIHLFCLKGREAQVLNFRHADLENKINSETFPYKLMK